MDTSNILGEKILSITILWNQSLGMVLFTKTATVPDVFEIFAHKKHATKPLIYFPINYFIVIATFQRSKMIMITAVKALVWKNCTCKLHSNSLCRLSWRQRRNCQTDFSIIYKHATMYGSFVGEDQSVLSSSSPQSIRCLRLNCDISNVRLMQVFSGSRIC